MSSSIFQPASLSPVLANVHSYASGLFGESSTLGFLTNSVLVALIVMSLVLWFSRKATKNMTLVPHKAQNFFEFIVEFLYNQVVGIVGEKQAKLAFPLLGTLFIYILVSNWFGLLPGVGTIGWGESTGFLSVKAAHDPLLRPPTADLNATIGLAVSAFLVWLFLTIKEIGVWGFIVHTFGPKGGLKGVMGMVVAAVFLFVGVIEVVSIIIRPVTLSIRLFGNIFAGALLLAILGALTAVAVPSMLYGLETFVGVIQAYVFAMLALTFMSQATVSHGGEEHGEGH